MALGEEDKEFLFTTGRTAGTYYGDNDSKVVRVKGQKLDSYARQKI